jgi:hypothetical protein
MFYLSLHSNWKNKIDQMKFHSPLFKSSSLMLVLFANITTANLQAQISKSPLMGWASWNNFGVNISESIINQQADAMVTSGLAQAGFNFINIDDGFFNGRNSDGSLRIDSVKFPHGLKYVADYIHSKGLKAGYYSDAGANTCGSQYNGQTGGIGVGLFGHDQQDADSVFSKWGYDFMKVDYCGGLTAKMDEETRYKAIRAAMDKTGRSDLSYNVCRWQFPGTWVTTVANSWRISTDIWLSWSSVTDIIDKNAYLAAYASQGHYNDMDMLEVGRGLTATEDKSHFSMWCILSSPLVLGNNLPTITLSTVNILTNAEVIAVNQDTTGLQGHIVTDNGAGLQVWAKKLNGLFSNERAVVLLNRTTASASMSVNWRDLDLIGAASARDLWSHTDLGTIDSIYTVTVPSHGVVMLKVVGTKSKLQEVFEGEYSWMNNFNLTKNSVVVADQGRAVTDATCSGKAKAGWLGNRADNWMEYRDIYANSAGSYSLSLTFISGENRNATFTINGKDTLVTLLNSGGWSTLKTRSFPVNLKSGWNTIRISNATGWMPDIDKIQLDLNKSFVPVNLSSVELKPVRLHPNPTTNMLQIESEKPVKQVDIYSMSGKKMLHSNQSRFSVSSLTPGTYLAKISTQNGLVNVEFIKM